MTHLQSSLPNDEPPPTLLEDATSKERRPAEDGDLLHNRGRATQPAQKKSTHNRNKSIVMKKKSTAASAAHGAGARRNRSAVGAGLKRNKSARDGTTVGQLQCGTSQRKARREEEDHLPEEMCSFEWIAVCVSILSLYLLLLYALHQDAFGVQAILHRTILHEHETMEQRLHDAPGRLVWDHPEPNFTHSSIIAEFYSTLTAIPIAGSMQLYLARKYRYAPTVVFVFSLAFWMYNSALFAHLSLNTHVFELTLSSVMFCALTTFFLYAATLSTAVPCPAATSDPPSLEKHLSLCFMVRSFTRHAYTRLLIATIGFAAVVFCAINLPSYIGHDGGVWTLFYVQTPPVLLAFGASCFLALHKDLDPRLQQAASYLAAAGMLLSTAMGVSYLECSTGTWQVEAFSKLVEVLIKCPECRAKLQNILGSVPFLHIMIHVLEQVGIYLFLTALACLHEHVGTGEGRQKSEGEKRVVKKTSIEWTHGFFIRGYHVVRFPYCYVKVKRS